LPTPWVAEYISATLLFSEIAFLACFNNVIRLCPPLLDFKILCYGVCRNIARAEGDQTVELCGKKNVDVEEVDIPCLRCFSEGGEKMYRIWVKERNPGV
jgi:hypothetical protein